MSASKDRVGGGWQGWWKRAAREEVETARKNGEGSGRPKTTPPIMLTITRLSKDCVVGRRGERRKTMEKMRPHAGTVRTKAVKNRSCR
jgi:hypothetical protein